MGASPPDRAAVVAGSGPNGLAAAIRLAEAGWAVTVLEAAARPGGAVRTEELTLPGFRHDTFSAVHPAAAASPVFARMALERHGLRWVHPAACLGHALEGGRAVVLARDLDATAASLGGSAGDRWRAFAAPLLEAWEPLRDVLLGGFPPVGPAARLVRELGVGRSAGLARTALGSARALADRLGAGDGARAWLYGLAGHADVPVARAGSAAPAIQLALLGHAVGWPSPEGGAQRLTDALVARLSELGGAVHCETAVTRIVAERGRVVGVEAVAWHPETPGALGRPGAELRIGADAVIADVMPHALLRLAGDALPAGYRALLRRYRYGPATVKLDWALDAPIPWSAPALRAAGTVHVGGGAGELAAALDGAARRLVERPFLLLGQQSLADPTRAPAGRHTAWAYAHAPRRGIDWARELDGVVARMEAQVERFAPGFRDRILARHVLSPAELERRDPNLVGGDVGGGSYRLPQLLARPLPARSPYRTPLRGLYLGSAAAYPGGGVHGVAGDAAARAALADAERR